MAPKFLGSKLISLRKNIKLVTITLLEIKEVILHTWLQGSDQFSTFRDPRISCTQLGCNISISDMMMFLIKNTETCPENQTFSPF